MPTYTVHCPAGLLAPDRKQLVARQDCPRAPRGHGGATFFAQVLFFNRPAGEWFVGGAPLEGGQVYVHGRVRAGRSPAVKVRARLAPAGQRSGVVGGAAS